MEIPIEGASWMQLMIRQIRQGIWLHDAKCAVLVARTIERFDRRCFPRKDSLIFIDTGHEPEAIADFNTVPPGLDRYKVFARGLARGLGKVAEDDGLTDSLEGLVKAAQVVAAHEVRHRAQEHCKHLTLFHFRSSRATAFEKYMRGLVRRGTPRRELRLEYDATMVEFRVAGLLRNGWDEEAVLRAILADAPRKR